MSSVECLREFVNERLAAAVEDIFGAFRKTVVEYEEEIKRQRRLLDLVWKPQIKLHRIELLQQHVCKEEILVDQQLCNQNQNSSVDQEDPDPPQIREEKDGGQLVLKQESDTVMLYEINHHSEPEPTWEHQLLSNNSHAAGSQDQKGGKRGGSGSTRNAEPEPKTMHHAGRSHSNDIKSCTVSVSNILSVHTESGTKYFKCDTCGKDFKYKSQFFIHQKVHTGERPYCCNTCGKRFSRKGCLKCHMTTHTGEKPYTCQTCCKDFRSKSDFIIHQRTHTGEKPYSCKTCGKRLSSKTTLKRHMITHTGERPYLCKTCGKSLSCKTTLKMHMIIHTGERPYLCKICGKGFIEIPRLKRHLGTHTGERKTFSLMSDWKRHTGTHTG
ncbi:zinc finger protein OZF-like [Morone saxatilis]|uniref:zinc finger protein OZF-like n=1 Tax=Morone saxatilis TaxID=34816 RepID=UPI0015E213CF|nr:zinc finger protein OZF-like [Morone saxatilis]